MTPFEPLFRNPHLATIAGNFWRRPLDEKRFPIAEKLYSTEAGVEVLVYSQTPARAAADLILVHGLEGSSAAGYARSLAQAGLERGYAVHRFNMRSCGGTEAMSGRTLYHSGQTGDLRFVAQAIRAEARRPLFLIGFSLGGNVVLKLAGEAGESAHEFMDGLAAVSTPLNLAACVRNLSKPANQIYARRFLDRLKKRIRVKERLTPGLFDLAALDAVKSVYDFDDRFTAPSFGFGTAATYYKTQSAQNFLGGIRVPALLVQAKDDPLIPFEVYDHPAFSRNPMLRLVAPEHGGHLGFLARRRPRFWLDSVVLEWIAEVRNKAVVNSVSL